MPHPQSSWPFGRPERLTELLREQGASPEECADLLPTLHRLSEWQAPQPDPADTRRLLAVLWGKAGGYIQISALFPTLVFGIQIPLAQALKYRLFLLVQYQRDETH